VTDDDDNSYGTDANDDRPADKSLPWPAGAIDVGDWSWDDSDCWCRLVTWRQWRITGRHYADVEVAGLEYTDGRLLRVIDIEMCNGLTAEQARVLAAAVIEAAEFTVNDGD
jgi:hypothetical protein